MSTNLTKQQKTERAEALERIRESLAPGDVVYCILRHRSRTNMSRVIQLVKMTEDGPRYLGWNAAKALGWSYDEKREGVRVGGCGFDAGHELVYNLSRALWPQGYGCTGGNCRSNDHSNGDRDRTPHGQFRPDLAVKLPSGLYDPASQSYKHWHAAGGYALRHAWL
jgi:hypothetical protein